MLFRLSVLKGEKGKFQTFQHELFLKANMLDISGHYGGIGSALTEGSVFTGRCFK